MFLQFCQMLLEMPYYLFMNHCSLHMPYVYSRQKLKALSQYRFRKHIELCIISFDRGSNVVHDSPPLNHESKT